MLIDQINIFIFHSCEAYLNNSIRYKFIWLRISEIWDQILAMDMQLQINLE